MNGCIVYEHENLVNGKRYFGITTKKPEHRWGRDGSGYDNNSHFWNAIQKYGWNEGFSHKILFEGLSVEEACEIEEMLITDYKTQDPEYGYNLLSGGQYRRHSEESRRKMSEAHKGKTLSEEHRRKISAALMGHEVSEEALRKMSENNAMRRPEARRKLSEAHKGKTLSEETRRKLSESMKGENHPNHGKHLSEETRRKISEASSGRKHSEETLRKMSDSHPSKAVEAIDPETGLRVYYFKSIMDAKRAGFGAGHISKCCKGKRCYKTHKGLIWRYVEKESN